MFHNLYTRNQSHPIVTATKQNKRIKQTYPSRLFQGTFCRLTVWRRSPSDHGLRRAAGAGGGVGVSEADCGVGGAGGGCGVSGAGDGERPPGGAKADGAAARVPS